MRIEQLRFLVEIINCGSFNQAAKKLYISQPALGQAITELEEELGGELVERSRRGVRPTFWGRKVYVDALAILENLSAAIESWHTDLAHARSIVGEVTIYAAPIMSHLFNFSFAPELKKYCPNITLSVIADHVLCSLPEKFCDEKAKIVVSYYRDEEYEDIVDALSRFGFAHEVLFVDYTNVVISSKNPLSKKEQLSVKDLENLSLVGYKDDLNIFQYADLFTADRVIRAESIEQIMHMVANNYGIALIGEKSNYENFYLKNGLVKVLPLEGQSSSFHFYLAYPNDISLDIAEQKTIECIKNYFNDGKYL